MHKTPWNETKILTSKKKDNNRCIWRQKSNYRFWLLLWKSDKRFLSLECDRRRRVYMATDDTHTLNTWTVSDNVLILCRPTVNYWRWTNYINTTYVFRRNLTPGLAVAEYLSTATIFQTMISVEKKLHNYICIASRHKRFPWTAFSSGGPSLEYGTKGVKTFAHVH